MIKYLWNLFLGWLLGLLGQTNYQQGRKDQEAEQEKALNEAKTRSDTAVADLGDGLRGLDDDPDNRDRHSR